jgi:hypothetical protein
MIAKAAGNAELILGRTEGQDGCSRVGDGIGWVAKTGGMAAGFSVRAVKGIGRRTARALQDSKKKIADALCAPTTDWIPGEISVGTRLRARRRIRGLRKEIRRLQKKMAPELVSVLMAGGVNPAEDERVQEYRTQIHTRQSEIDDLKAKLEEKRGMRVPVVPKGGARKARLAEAGSQTMAAVPVQAAGEREKPSAPPTAEPLPSEAETPAAKTAIAEAGWQPHLHVLRERAGESRKESISPVVAAAPARPTPGAEAAPAERKTEPGRAQGPRKTEAQTGTPGPGLLLEEILGQAEFSLASERLAFEEAVRDAGSEDPLLREMAAQHLSKIKNPAATRVLTVLAEDPRQTVRARSLDALLAQQAEGVFPLFATAAKDRSSRVRITALRGLYKVDSVKAVPHLIEALADEDAGVRRRAVTCLSWAGAREATLELISLLDDPDTAVRRAVVDALEAMRTKVAVPRLIDALDAEDAQVREAAYKALRNLTGQSIVFDPSVSAEARAKGKAKWKEWWEENKATFSIP